MAPVVEVSEVEDNGVAWTLVKRRRGGRRGKANATHITPGHEESVEPVLSPPSEPSVKERKRGRRGLGHRDV